MGPITSFADLRSMVLRRAAVIAAVLSAGILATLVYAFSIPTAYEATSVIQVQSGPISMGGDQMAPARRLQLIEQRLMSRGNVLRLVARHGLYEGEAGVSDDQKVSMFRSNADIQMITSAGRAPAEGEIAPVTALIITARADAADQAADVVNELASSLINQDREDRFAANTAALQFLRGEQERLATQLAAVDAQIGTIKERNEESLPEVSEAIRSEQAQVRELLLDLEQRELDLERQQLVVELRNEDLASEDAGPTLADRLRKLSGELGQARRLLPSDHPEVGRIEREIQALRSGDLAAALTGADREIALIRQQREALARQVREVKARRDEIERALESGPVVAQQLTSLGRRQAVLADQMAAIALQLSQTESQRQLQEEAEGSGMEILEAAEPPRYPLSSSRKRVAVLGAAASLGAAFLAALLLDMRRPVMRTAAQVERALGVAPIASVPAIPSPARRTALLLNYALAFGILAAAAFAASSMITARQDAAVVQPQS